MSSLQQFGKTSSWREDNITVESGEVGVIDFIDTKPNMFIVQNANSVDLRVGIAKIPTTTNYEFAVEKNSVQTLGKPTSTSKLYILNIGQAHATVKVFSIYDEFDLNVLKEVKLDINGASVVTDGIVKGFRSDVELPTGNNLLGRVSIENGSVSLKSGNAVIGSVGLNSTAQNTVNAIAESSNTSAESVAELANLILKKGETTPANLLSDIISGLSGITVTGVEIDDTNIISKLTEVNAELEKFNALHDASKNAIVTTDVPTFSLTPTSDKFVHFDYLMVDGNVDAMLQIDGEDAMRIYAGEQFADLEFFMPSGCPLTISGIDGNATLRLKWFQY